jgi:hypothetical protein
MKTSASILTVRGLSREASARLKRQAAREKSSVNSVVVRMLGSQAGAHRDAPTASARDLADLAGKWTVAQAKAFEAATAPFSAIDQALWKKR